MTASKKRKLLRQAYMAEQNTYAPAYETLRKARMCLGISQERLAERMGISDAIWQKYENGALRIPGSVMLKIFMFGLDFWCERDW